MTEREQRAKSFDAVAELYDRARPAYPEEIFDDLFVLAGLGASSSVLEIGCGPGKASVSLARRGCSLTCVEPGAHLVEVAKRNLTDFLNARVVLGTFETWVAQESFDAVFAAASWHWLDPEARYTRAVSLLRPHGVLAIVTMAHAFPRGFDPIFSEIQPFYIAIGKGLPKWPPPPPEEVPDLREEIEKTGLFFPAEVKRYLWTVNYTADEYVDTVNTHSDHRVMSTAQRDKLFTDIKAQIGSRSVKMHYQAILHVAHAK